MYNTKEEAEISAQKSKDMLDKYWKINIKKCNKGWFFVLTNGCRSIYKHSNGKYSCMITDTQNYLGPDEEWRNRELFYKPENSFSKSLLGAIKKAERIWQKYIKHINDSY
ncbi:MAG: hypothetical protein AABY32_00845 [Nanoarchaeota archaeon]